MMLHSSFQMAPQSKSILIRSVCSSTLRAECQPSAVFEETLDINIMLRNVRVTESFSYSTRPGWRIGSFWRHLAKPSISKRNGRCLRVVVSSISRSTFVVCSPYAILPGACHLISRLPCAPRPLRRPRLEDSWTAPQPQVETDYPQDTSLGNRAAKKPGVFAVRSGCFP